MKQPAITGYRELDRDEVELINKIKLYGLVLNELIDEIQQHISDQKLAGAAEHLVEADAEQWAGIGRTSLQQGLMALTRAVAQPTTF